MTFSQRLTVVLCILFVLAIAFVHECVVRANAAPPAVSDPALAPWFRSLTNPVTGISCCAESDGHILRDDQWRVAGDRYQVLIDGAWRDVPAAAVMQRVDNPTGGAVVFYIGAADPRILCFIRPVET